MGAHSARCKACRPKGGGRGCYPRTTVSRLDPMSTRPSVSRARLAVLLGGLAMFGPFAIDTIFPAFRAIESEFAVSATDEVVSKTTPWTIGGDSSLDEGERWQIEMQGDEGRWHITDNSSESDQYLISPPLAVTGDLSLSFRHRYSFESSDANYDGGVLELSEDGGMTWTDIGHKITMNGYGTDAIDRGNPALGGRRGFVEHCLERPGVHRAPRAHLVRSEPRRARSERRRQQDREPHGALPIVWKLDIGRPRAMPTPSKTSHRRRRRGGSGPCARRSDATTPRARSGRASGGGRRGRAGVAGDVPATRRGSDHQAGAHREDVLRDVRTTLS